MRLWTIGTSEPNWWQKNFFSRHKDGDVVVFDDYGKPVIVPDCSRFQVRSFFKIPTCYNNFLIGPIS